MSKTSRFSLGGKTLPIDVHSAWVDVEGLPIDVGGPVLFEFSYHDVRFAGRYEEDSGQAHLKLVGDAGPLPFTAEAPAARAGLARIVEAANDVLALKGQGPAFRITHGRIMLGRDLPVVTPVTATGLVATIAAFLIPATPYLDLMSVYVRPPLAPAKAGESAVRPEFRLRRAISVRGR